MTQCEWLVMGCKSQWAHAYIRVQICSHVYKLLPCTSLVIHAGMRWQSSVQLSNSLGLLVCTERKVRTLFTVVLKALHSRIAKPWLVRELWLETQRWVPAPTPAPPYLGQMGERVDHVAGSKVRNAWLWLSTRTGCLGRLWGLHQGRLLKVDWKSSSKAGFRHS